MNYKDKRFGRLKQWYDPKIGHLFLVQGFVNAYLCPVNLDKMIDLI
jgi:hypothetical protein